LLRLSHWLGTACVELFGLSASKRGAPYALDDNFTPDEKQCIAELLAPILSAEVDAGYNTWRILKFSKGVFFARRMTWKRDGVNATTLLELAKLVAAREESR